MERRVDTRFVLFLDCPAEVSTESDYSARVADWNLYKQVSADRCLLRGAGGGGRVDDNVESLKKRHATYENETRREGCFLMASCLSHVIFLPSCTGTLRTTRHGSQV